MQDLKIAIVQCNLHWEDANKNIQNFNNIFSSIAEPIDVIVLPEMFTTGFTVNPVNNAEKMYENTFIWMKQKAHELNCAIVGSLIIEENNKYYNRLIFMKEDGSFEFYDKRHLFQLAGEHLRFANGSSKILIQYKGWNFLPLICYDLRFPVWSKNRLTKNNIYDYDCLIYVANWPERRTFAWSSLLTARAIENQAYVVGVNRIGIDGTGISYSGASAIIDPKGKPIISTDEHKESVYITTLSKKALYEYREQFKVGLDWDKFSIDL